MVNVLISADSKYPISRPAIKKRIEKVLADKRITSDTEISVLICGTRKSRDLANKFLDDDQPHTVLSFPLEDELTPALSPTARSAKGFVENPGNVLVLGDIVICYPLAQEEANKDNMLVNEKICDLAEHGLLHLLGEHHE